MRIQLWSYNYDPEPTGIGPVSRVWAQSMRARGHQVDVVAAHPHYPEPRWGTRLRPYREVRDGIDVLRLPLWIGRATSAERYRQELTFMASQFLAIPALARPDVAVVVSPSFPALLPAIVGHRLRRTPWALWLHDILPDGAAATGLVDEGSFVLRASRHLERAAYKAADRIVVLSRSFITNLTGKGVEPDKIELIYDPATRLPRARAVANPDARPLRILSMGNIGYSQGLAPLVRAFEASEAIDGHEIKLVITGNGVAADEVRREIRSDRVEMLGVVDNDELERQLQGATVAFVSQQHDGAEFNIPSKMMNFMAYGLPVLAAVNPASEVAQIVDEAGAGWVVDSGAPDTFPAKVADLLANPSEIAPRAQASFDYAQANFTHDEFASRFERLLEDILAARAA